MKVDWRTSEEFGVLCDVVASDHLVCLTGAGISRGMRRKHPPSTTETLPGWIPLLRELLDAFKSRMKPQDVEVAGRLLAVSDERPGIKSLETIARNYLSGAEQAEALDAIRTVGPVIGSHELILAASLIRANNVAAFDGRFREAVTEAPGQCSQAHLALAALLPRGIVTFNYDGGHEEAWRRQGMLDYITLNPTDAASEEAFRLLLEIRLRSRFLLKAHGSVESVYPLVLTIEEYRSLIAKNPSFRAFVQNLFTNFSFLMVGYGLDDPDFDLFLRTMAEQFAGPLQTHIVIRPIAQKHRRQDVERQLYGIRTLHINHYGEIVDVLNEATQTAGPVLRQTIDGCLSPQHKKRDIAHAQLSELGEAGRAVAGTILLTKLNDSDSFIASEAAYSLGILDARRYKSDLCAVINRRSEADVIGRTLTVLRSAFTRDDLPQIRRWQIRFRATPATGTRPGRIKTYLNYLASYVRHKYRSDPASIHRRGVRVSP